MKTRAPFLLGFALAFIVTLAMAQTFWALPGTSVLDPGTGFAEMVLPAQTNATSNGACSSACTFGPGDLFKKTRRSNGGSSMSDTFPAASASGMVNGARLVVSNTDASATLTTNAGSGTVMPAGGSTDTIGPGRDVAYEFDTTVSPPQWRGSYNTRSALLAANNLSELTSAATARGNLGLGVFATASSVTPSQLATQNAYTFLGNFTGSLAAPTATAIGSLTNKSSPTTSDLIPIADEAASGAIKYATIGQVGTALSSGIGAALQANPSNPTGNSSTSAYKMMGLGADVSHPCKITPAATGRIRFTIIANGGNTSGADYGSFELYYGSGTAPANAASVTGTEIGGPWIGQANVVGTNPLNAEAIVTGLTVGTAYWFDLAAEAGTAGTTALSSVSCLAQEF